MNASALSRMYHSRIFRSIVVILGLIALTCVGLVAWFVPGFAIREAASSGNLGVIKVLLACNHHLVSTGDAFGQTPLHYAASNGQIKAATLLLANGADVEAKTDLGATPLDMAAGAGNKNMIELLLANHADINGRDRDGFQQSPLFGAVINHHRDMAKLLLTNHADVNAKDKDGTTPLHLAVSAAFYQHDKQMIELLLTNHADVNAKGKEGTPLHMAVEYKMNDVEMNDVVELLRAHGGQE